MVFERSLGKERERERARLEEEEEEEEEEEGGVFQNLENHGFKQAKGQHTQAGRKRERENSNYSD